MKDVKLQFTKMQGAGNDYIYMDLFTNGSLELIPEKEYPELSRRVSDRHFGIGSDGLILILPSTVADFQMKIFNADGSEAQMCGNGIRCVGKYVYDKGLTEKKSLTIETLAGIKILELNVKSGKVQEVTVDMGKPLLKRKDIPAAGDPESKLIQEKIEIDGKNYEITGVGMGNPHCVIFVEDSSGFDVAGVGRKIENHELWPEKTNVEFVEVTDSCNLKMRVWERGSGETFACGTGACATAVASRLRGFTGDEVTITLLGGELKIRYDQKTDHIFMTGPAEVVAEGIYYYKFQSGSDNK